VRFCGFAAQEFAKEFDVRHDADTAIGKKGEHFGCVRVPVERTEDVSFPATAV